MLEILIKYSFNIISYVIELLFMCLYTLLYIMYFIYIFPWDIACTYGLRKRHTEDKTVRFLEQRHKTKVKT